MCIQCAYPCCCRALCARYYLSCIGKMLNIIICDSIAVFCSKKKKLKKKNNTRLLQNKVNLFLYFFVVRARGRFTLILGCDICSLLETLLRLWNVEQQEIEAMYLYFNLCSSVMLDKTSWLFTSFFFLIN